MPAAPTQNEKDLARYLRYLLGGEIRVRRHEDGGDRTIAVLTARGSGIHHPAAATVGLSSVDLGLTANGLPLRAEILLACPDDDDVWSNLVASASLAIMNEPTLARPNRIVREMLSLYDRSTAFPHLLLSDASDFPVETMTFPDMAVAWLQAIPISTAEADLAEHQGPDALTTRLENACANIRDPHRQSVV